MQRSTQHPRRRAWLRRLIVVAVLAAAVGALLSQTVFAQTSYIITDGDRVTVHRSYSSDPYEVLTEAGIELEEEDTYETGYADGMNQITVRRMQMVTVINRGAQSVIGTYGETAGSLLARMGITPGAGDTLSCSSETQTYDGRRASRRRIRSSPIPSIIMRTPTSSRMPRSSSWPGRTA